LGVISYYYLIYPIRRYNNIALRLEDIMVNNEEV
jgi:hypothetical protein